MDSDLYEPRTEIYEKGMELYLNHHSVGLVGNHENFCETFFGTHHANAFYFRQNSNF